jgi:hypothetical protein
MDAKDVVMAVIAVSGVVASVIVSVVVTRRDILARNRNLFDSLLIQKRFEHYPELYRVISSFIKVLRDIPKGVNAASISNDMFRKFRDYILDWDSKYSYLMSERCVKQWARYYWMLEKYSADDLVKDQKKREYIINETTGVESALKSDLGVYTIESLGVNTFYSYYPDSKSWRESLLETNGLVPLGRIPQTQIIPNVGAFQKVD